MGITAAPPKEGDLGGGAHETGEASEPMPFKFVAWGGSADVSFWHRLADFKLDTQKLTEEPIAISGINCLLSLIFLLTYCRGIHLLCDLFL